MKKYKKILAQKKAQKNIQSKFSAIHVKMAKIPIYCYKHQSQQKYHQQPSMKTSTGDNLGKKCWVSFNGSDN